LRGALTDVGGTREVSQRREKDRGQGGDSPPTDKVSTMSASRRKWIEGGQLQGLWVTYRRGGGVSELNKNKRKT